MSTENISLYFKDDKSDKVYNATLEKSDGLFIVNFAYGKRDGNLKAGTKTKEPVAYDKAKAIYDKLVKSKTDKGYKPRVDSKTKKTSVGAKPITKKVKTAKAKSNKSKAKSNPTEVSAYYEELKACIENSKPVLPVLKKIPKAQYNDIGELIYPYVKKLGKGETRKERDFYENQKFEIFLIEYFFGPAKCIKSYSLYNRLEQLDAALKVYVRPDLYEIVSQSYLSYATRMDYYKKGYIKQEKNSYLAYALASTQPPVLDDTMESVVKKLSLHEETLRDDIYLLFDPNVDTDGNKKTWKKIILHLIKNEIISKDRLIKVIIANDVSGKGLKEKGSSFLRDQLHIFSWMYDILKSVKPSDKQILTVQKSLLKVLDSDMPSIKKVSLALLKQIVLENKFDDKTFILKAQALLEISNIAEADLILSIYGALIAKDAKLASKLVKNSSKATKKADKKVVEKINKFVQKYAGEALAKDLAKESTASKGKVSKKDLGGWTAEEIDKISKLLLSVEDGSVQVAFSLLENRDFPMILLSEVFAIAKITSNKGIRTIAESIIEKEASEDIFKLLTSKLSLGYGNTLNPPTEKTIKKNIGTYVKGNELDGLKIAQALYQGHGLGIAYLLDESTEENKIEIFKSFIQGTVLKLTGIALTKFPSTAFNFPELTEIDLSDNKIGSIPADIEVFKNLKALKINDNKITSIHKNFGTLVKLVELDLSNNALKKGVPDFMFKLVNLQKLDLTKCQDQDQVFELSMDITNLKKLKLFRLDDAGRRRTNDSYTNYPQIKEVTGNPIDMDPLAVAVAAYDQGDMSSISYILKHGDSKLINRVLDKFYDKKSKTLNFIGLHVDRLPIEILKYDIEVLNLNDCGMGRGRYFIKEEDVDLEELEKTAILTKIKNLKELSLNGNYFVELSDLSSLTNLEKLTISDMMLDKLFDFTPLKNLTILKLEKLELNEFPKSIFTLEKLTSLSMYRTFSYVRGKLTFKEFKGISNLKKITSLTLRDDRFVSKEEFEKVLSLLPSGCEVSKR